MARERSRAISLSASFYLAYHHAFLVVVLGLNGLSVYWMIRILILSLIFPLRTCRDLRSIIICVVVISTSLLLSFHLLLLLCMPDWLHSLIVLGRRRLWFDLLLMVVVGLLLLIVPIGLCLGFRVVRLLVMLGRVGVYRFVSLGLRGFLVCLFVDISLGFVRSKLYFFWLICLPLPQILC